MKVGKCPEVRRKINITTFQQVNNNENKVLHINLIAILGGIRSPGGEILRGKQNYCGYGEQFRLIL